MLAPSAVRVEFGRGETHKLCRPAGREIPGNRQTLVSDAREIPIVARNFPRCAYNPAGSEQQGATWPTSIATSPHSPDRSGPESITTLVRRARPKFALVAPHGGGIEPGTSELADAIAGSDLSFYTFEGLKSSGNTDLHITSTRFDEPMCLTLLASSSVVVTLHGEHSTKTVRGSS
jgi:Poly-gamma-glutamate hydrolase